LAGIVDHLDRPVPDRRDRLSVADRDERGKAEVGAIVPTFGDDFRADSGRIAERLPQRLPLTDLGDQRYSITASRRRSRR
jgi:hypothetical protein